MKGSKTRLNKVKKNIIIVRKKNKSLLRNYLT